MFLYQNRKSSALTEHETKSTQDSTRYAAVIAQRRAAEEQRDSVIRQINVIRAIDGTRYVWPHILDEVSRALTPYTWLKSLEQTSAVVELSPEVEAGLGAGDAKNKTKLEAKADSDADRRERSSRSASSARPSTSRRSRASSRSSKRRRGSRTSCS